jgi:hypothetical protein
MLIRLIYHSENHIGAGGRGMLASLNAIMETANYNNKRDSITGALLFDTLWFVQILEGERETVSATLRRIIADERHSDVTIMDARPIEARQFGEWWMGLALLRDAVALYERHGLGSKLNPRVMTGEQTVALALDLGTKLNRGTPPTG